jgi:TolA-binding protein
MAPEFDQSYLNLARLYAMQNEREKARTVLVELERRQPGNAGAKKAMEVLDSLP